MAAAKSTAKSTEARTKGLVPWQPGRSGNPAGKKLGTRNRKTVIMEAMRRIAEKRKVTPEEVEEALQVAGLDRALKGSFFHFKEMSDGLYGKITDKMDVTSGGKTLADLMTIANGNPKRGGKTTPEV